MADAFIGDWKQVSSEHLGKYMRQLKVNPLVRKAGKVIKPKLRIEKKSELEWSLTVLMPPLKLFKSKCKLDEKFTDVSPTGSKGVFYVHYDVDKSQFVTYNYDKDEPDTVVSVITQEILPDGHLKITSAAGDVVATQIYKRTKKLSKELDSS